MKNFLLIFIFTGSLFLITSCKKQSHPNYIIETETSEALLNKDIDSVINGIGQTVYYVKAGSKTVFKYEYTRENKTPGIVDGQVYYTCAFAVDLNSLQTSFLLTDEQIKTAPAFYVYFNGVDSNPMLLSGGKISGTKINSTTWNVVIHFLSGPFRDLTKNFTIK